MISREPDGTFLVLVTGPGPLEELAHATDLAESAEKVLAIYRARQDASGESRPPRAR